MVRFCAVLFFLISFTNAAFANCVNCGCLRAVTEKILVASDTSVKPACGYNDENLLMIDEMTQWAVDSASNLTASERRTCKAQMDNLVDALTNQTDPEMCIDEAGGKIHHRYDAQRHNRAIWQGCSEDAYLTGYASEMA